MILLVTGAALVALGLLAGAVLVAVPFGWVALEPGLSLWLLFPLFSLAGLSLVVVGARATHVRSVALGVSCFLLALALASATGLVLAAASLVPATGGTGSLWFVLAVAGTLGSTGAAAWSRASSDS